MVTISTIGTADMRTSAYDCQREGSVLFRSILEARSNVKLHASDPRGVTPRNILTRIKLLVMRSLKLTSFYRFPTFATFYARAFVRSHEIRKNILSECGHHEKIHVPPITKVSGDAFTRPSPLNVR